MADSYDLDSILRSMYQLGPTAEERRRAGDAALLKTGLGILSANQPSVTPRNSLGVLAQGAMPGVDAYQQSVDKQLAERKTGGVLALQALQVKKQLEQQQALKNLLQPQGAPAPEQTEPSAGVSPSSAEVIGAPWAVRPPTAAPAAMAPHGGYRPISPERLAAAAAAGVDINPFLKLNSEARPDVIHVDTGKEIIFRDKKTMRELGRVPKEAAPGSVPFEAQDIGPSAYRDFLIGKSSAGASKTVTNVNAFTPASEEAQRDFIKSTRTTYDQLKQAPVALESIEKAKALIPDARGFLGPGGESALDAAKFLNNRLGMSIDPEGVKSAEELRTRIFFNIMDNLKKMDAQPSQQQQKIMQEALGTLGTDPNALPRVLDAFGDVIKGKVELHNNEVKGAITRGVKFPYDPIINIQQSAPTGPKLKRYNPTTGRIE